LTRWQPYWYDSNVAESALTTEDVKTDNEPIGEPAVEDNTLEPLIALAGALLDTDRLRIAATLATRPASRMELAEATGLPHRELLRQLGVLQEFGLIKPQVPAYSEPDAYTPYVLNEEAFRSARQAMGRYKGVKPRPSDAREMTLETFMPAGKLAALPRKHGQMLVVLDEVARRFEPERQYAEREVNVILEEINEDYCTLRRLLVDYGYLTRSKGIYTRKA
jgi:ArsR family transcriptional regulator, arsenate/arsenite/antimonite-responsive transcriptional repressor